LLQIVLKCHRSRINTATAGKHSTLGPAARVQGRGGEVRGKGMENMESFIGLRGMDAQAHGINSCGKVF